MAYQPRAQPSPGVGAQYRSQQPYQRPPPPSYQGQVGYWAPPAQPPPPMEPEPAERRASQTPSILVLVGVLLLVATFFVPWYVVNFSGTDSRNNSFSGSLDVYTMDICVNGVATGSSTGSVGQCFLYFQAQRAILFFLSALLLILAMVLGVVSGLFGLRTSSARGPVATKAVKRPYRMARWTFIVLLIGVVLFFLTAIGNMSELANADCTNSYTGYSGSPVMGSCPWSMSNNGDKISGTLSWAPSAGLVVAFVGLALVLAGMVKLRRYFKDMSYWDPSNEPPAQSWPSQPQYPPTPYYPTTVPPRAGPKVNQAMSGGQGDSPQCPSCGQYTTYLPASASWYCHNCSQLVR